MFLGRSVAAIVLFISATSGFHSEVSGHGATKPVSTIRFTQDTDIKCLEYAVETVNPDAGPSTHILNFPKACAFPWHYHTAEEQMMVVQGVVSVQMDHSGAVSLGSGGFAVMPSKMPHRFSCVSDDDCRVFVHFDRVYDIFWQKNR
jgi:quercetin dioxygenase-like cupin family protein